MKEQPQSTQEEQPKSSTPPVESQPPVTPVITSSIQPSKSRVGLVVAIILSSLVLIGLIGLAYTMIVNNSTNRTTRLPSDQQTTQKTNGSESTTACVTVGDLKDFFDVEIPAVNLEESTYLNGITVFFEADSSVYSYADQTLEHYDKYAGFYTTYNKKNFNYYLRASTYESAASETGQKVAQERADKVKSELVSRGVPAERIIIDESTVSTYDPESMRNVSIDLRNSETCVKSDN